MKNIYFTGKAGSGKTHATDYIISEYGYVKAKMAAPVYAIAQNYFDMKEKDRELLQYIGTDVARELVDINIWVKRFVEDTKIAQITNQELYGERFGQLFFVSDDVRFKNEYECLRDAGWVGIYLDSPDEVRFKRLNSRDGDAKIQHLNHASETELDTFKNDLIKVDSSVHEDEMFKSIDKIIKGI